MAARKPKYSVSILSMEGTGEWVVLRTMVTLQTARRVADRWAPKTEVKIHRGPAGGELLEHRK
jgi:hypothetical protein